MKNNKKIILKVLVGSRVQGLADEKSDYDYKSVYVLPTSEIVSLNYKYKGTSWTEGEIDNTAYELGHFLALASKCNPTILEVFKAPVIEANRDGKKLRKLFSNVLDSEQIYKSFIGYGLNQRKRFLERKDNREHKYAIAYTRVLFNLIELLSTKTFTVKIGKLYPIADRLKRYRDGNYTVGEVIDFTEQLRNKAKIVLDECPKQERNATDLIKLNKFLVGIRRRYWK